MRQNNAYDALVIITERIVACGGHPFIVGGFVRDYIRGEHPKDMDIEVHNIPAATLIDVLSNFGKVDTVGVSFGVIKLWTEEGDFDFSLPRRENKKGRGHKGFQVEIDPFLTIEEALERRDFTFNSMAIDLVTNEIVDPFYGRVDLNADIIRHTSDKFSEDPLRVLRGMQFAGRFGMCVSPETARLCFPLKNEFADLAIERVWGEWEKWGESFVPSRGLIFLHDTGWLDLFPELAALVGCQLRHPEGGVFTHTCCVVNAMAEICERDRVTGTDRVARMFGALCHDFGKPNTTIFEDGRWKSPTRAFAGIEPTRSFLTRIGMPVSLIERVVEMVREHMVHIDFNGSPRSVRRLLARLKEASILDVMAVIEADHNGQPPLSQGLPAEAKAMKEIADSMGNEIKPILMGRHLIETGIESGTEMGRILKLTFEAQLDGVFEDVESGKAWVEKHSSARFHELLEKSDAEELTEAEEK
jgi:tRNA nucleotidyltransferase (CCA-adding enzyme)